MPKLLNGIKGDSKPGSLDCESGMLPLGYRAPQEERSITSRHIREGISLLG